mgnify:CR=1 FL=1
MIGTERHESRRIDNQLRGRSGRQGDPGSSIFFISHQDELMRIFGGDSIDGMLKKLGLKENDSIYHPWINKAADIRQAIKHICRLSVVVEIRSYIRNAKG